MKRLTILNICLLFTMVSSFAQTVLETYDVNDDKQTTVILRDSVESDEDILDQLDLDDYTVGEEVYITAEMWASIQKEQEKAPSVAIIEENFDNKMTNPVIEKEMPKEIILQEKTVVQTAVKPTKVTKTTKAKSSSSKKVAKKKKAKKKKRVKMKKSKRRKGASGSRGGRMTCYRF